jgi:hypothetical protein
MVSYPRKLVSSSTLPCEHQILQIQELFQGNPDIAAVPNDKRNLEGNTDVTSGIKLFETQKTDQYHLQTSSRYKTSWKIVKRST